MTFGKAICLMEQDWDIDINIGIDVDLDALDRWEGIFYAVCFMEC